MSLAPSQLEAMLEASGAMLRGHFLLSSGRHSDTYVEKFRLLEQPEALGALCAAIADRFAGEGIEIVAGPTTGGVIVAFEVARRLGVQARYVETENGEKKLRRGASLPRGARVLLVDDVLTTGLSLREAALALRARGAEVVATAALIDRSEGFESETPFFAACRVEARSFAPDAVPAELAALPLTKPGTRAPA